MTLRVLWQTLLISILVFAVAKTNPAIAKANQTPTSAEIDRSNGVNIANMAPRESIRECRAATTGDVAACTALAALIAAIAPYLLTLAGATGSALTSAQSAVIAILARYGITITAQQVSGLSVIVAGGTGYSCISVSDAAKALLSATGIPAGLRSMAESCNAVIEEFGAGCVAIADICVEAYTGGPVASPNPGDSPGVEQGRRCVAEWNLNPFISRCDHCRACCSSLPNSQTGGCHAVCNAQYDCRLPVLLQPTPTATPISTPPMR